MSDKVKFMGKVWTVLKQCSGFVLAHVGDEVRNIAEHEIEKIAEEKLGQVNNKSN